MPSPSPYGFQQQRPQQQHTTGLQHSDSRLSGRSDLPPPSPRDQHPLDISRGNSVKLKGKDPLSHQLPQRKRKSLLLFHFGHSMSQESNGNPVSNLHSSLKNKKKESSIVTVVPSDSDHNLGLDKPFIDSRIQSPTTGLRIGARPSQPYFKTASSSLSKASFLVSLRAATLLLPLYGLHYLVIVYRPDVE